MPPGDVVDMAFKKAQTPAPTRERFIEVGSSGLKSWGGVLDEEFLRELRGVSGVRIYREMSKNDAVIGASLFAYTTLAKEVSFRVESAKQNDTLSDEIAEFVRGALFDDMNMSWRDLLGEIFSFLAYGWSYFEVVYKRRLGPDPSPLREAVVNVRDGTTSGVKVQAQAKSRFNDSKIGWRKWAIRSQDSLIRWEIDANGGIAGMVQATAPVFEQVFIPIEKSLLFRTLVERNSPEGVSVLRTAYPTWYEKRRIRIVRGIGIERDLAGLPVLTPPENVDIWNTNDPAATTLKTQAEKVVRNIRRDEHEGIVKPFGWSLDLLASSGARQFDITATIAQLNSEIAMSMMTDFLLIGHEQVGARSLATDKRAVFSHAAASFLDSICDVINRFAIPDLVKLNGWPPELAPVLKHGPVAEIELAELTNFVEKMSQSGLLFPDDELERDLRRRAMLPPPPEREALPDDAVDVPTPAGVTPGLSPNPETGEPVSTVTLNGAQVSALIEVITSVATGQIPRETGVATIQAAFNLSATDADKLMGTVGRGFSPASPKEPAQPVEKAVAAAVAPAAAVSPNLSITLPNITMAPTVNMPEPHVDVHVEQPVVHVAAPVVNVEPPAVTVTAPVVHVAAPAVTVEQPDIHVTSPDVHVHHEAPQIDVTVEQPDIAQTIVVQPAPVQSAPEPVEKKQRNRRVERDDKGRITKIIDEE